ncbi:unnamed protein product [Protopolystoma xenopodis]|uniref:Uncharacterized protein n=1 Tax=Protopolystoma xenopodis TaxID=117903 RepID=A0A3S5A5X9_9PLAT|nr:unnamed protein product [Protopolystoma xenopodis]
MAVVVAARVASTGNGEGDPDQRLTSVLGQSIGSSAFGCSLLAGMWTEHRRPKGAANVLASSQRVTNLMAIHSSGAVSADQARYSIQNADTQEDLKTTRNRKTTRPVQSGRSGYACLRGQASMKDEVRLGKEGQMRFFLRTRVKVRKAALLTKFLLMSPGGL